MCQLVNLLESNPKVKQRMIEEIERVLGKDPNSILTLEDLSKLEYVEAVIKEGNLFVEFSIREGNYHFF